MTTKRNVVGKRSELGYRENERIYYYAMLCSQTIASCCLFIYVTSGLHLSQYGRLVAQCRIDENETFDTNNQLPDRNVRRSQCKNTLS